MQAGDEAVKTINQLAGFTLFWQGNSLGQITVAVTQLFKHGGEIFNWLTDGSGQPYA